jgi:SNF2 family DNA or RNA helicase
MKTKQPAIRRSDSWAHQCEAHQFALDHIPAANLAMGMGTGKSKSAIDVVMNEGALTVLVLCPKSVLGVWRREIEKHWSTKLPKPQVSILDTGTCKHKTEVLSRLMLYGDATRQRFVVANYDAAWRAPLGDEILKSGFHCVVGDELHRIKAPGGKASRWMQRLGLLTRRRLGLTGTPMPHSPLDLYAQFRFLDPRIFGTSFTRFRARYAINNPVFPSQIRQWINQEELQEKFLSITYQCKADEVLDLPEVIHETRTCQLDAKTARVYQALEKEFIAEVDAGVVTVANALTKTLRLRQVTSGFVGGRDEEDTEFIQELGSEKEKLLADLLEDIAEPVVVFAEFRHDLDTIERVAKSLGRRYGELSGRRHDLTNHAEMPADIDVFGAQIQAGSVGVDLTRACYVIYFSPTWSLGNYQQSIARVHRPGQTRCVRIYAIVAENTVDELVYKALAKRQDVVNYIINERKGAAA